MIFFFKLLCMFQLFYNVYYFFNEKCEQKHVSATTLQKLPLWGGGGEVSDRRALERADKYLGLEEPGRASVGSVRPQGQPWTVVQPGLLHDRVPPLCPSPKASCTLAGRLGQLPSLQGGGAESEFLESEWPEWCRGEWVPRDGWPGGQGQHQQWTESGAQAWTALTSSLLLGVAVCCSFSI